MSAISQSDVAELIHALNNLYISRLMAAVAATLTLYDWILVFPIEYKTIYQSRWTIAKCLFVYIRVVTPPGIIFGAFHLSDLRPPLSSGFCTVWIIIVIFGMHSSVFAANGLLTLRLTALYKRKTLVVWFIRLFFFASYAVTLALCIDALRTFGKSIYYNTEINLCSSTEHSKSMSSVFYAPSAYEAFVFALTAFGAIKDSKILSGSSSAPFLVMLYRDGIISFIIMVVVRAWNVWIYLTQPLSSYNMGTLLMWAINTVLTTRVYMNLVWLARKPANTMDMSESGPATVPGGIRMRVHRVTEVHTDTWRSRTQQSDNGAHNQAVFRDSQYLKNNSITFDVKDMPESPESPGPKLPPEHAV